MENFHFQGKSLNAEQRDKVSKLFGHLRYSITSNSFEVIEGERRLAARYMVAGETDSTIRLVFPRPSDMPDLTLYRVSINLMFIRIDKNLEYFRRAAA
jgi:hypothetical protein